MSVADPARVSAAINRAVYADHVKALFSRHGVEVVIDVGANTGQFARFVRDTGFTGRIVSYEPVAEPFRGLAEASRTDRQWEVHQLALGEEEAEVSVNVARSHDFSSLLPVSDYGASTFADRTGTLREERVPMRRLDTALPEPARGVPAFLKIDTQGWDLRVLRSAAGILGDVVGVQLEVALRPIYDGMPTFEEVLAALRERGFTPSALLPVSRDADLRLIEVDCIAVRS